jgi:4-hydroxybenzoate polyprenyltransferase
VGVTAGASTPNWVIEKVIDRIARFSSERERGVRKALSSLVEFLVKGDLYVGIGAAALCFACAVMRGMEAAWLSVLVSGYCVFAIHVLNHYTDREYAQYKESYKLNVLEKYKVALVTSGLIAAGVAVGLSVLIGPVALALIVFVTLIGLAYNVAIVPGGIAKMVGIRRVRDLPMSKNLGTALAWCLMIVVLPMVELGKRVEVLPTLTVLAFSFAVVFARSTLLDLRDVQGDMMIGNETIPIMIGERKTKLLLALVVVASVTLVVVGSIMGWVNGSGFVQLVTLGYVLGYLLVYHFRLMNQAIRCEIVADTGFVLAAALAASWLLLS